MLPTPSTSHVNYAHIYEPAEDSYLLLDTLSSSSEATFLHNRFPATAPSPLVLEVGPGSGVVLAFATANANHIIGRIDAVSIGVDVNPFACTATAQTVQGAIKDAHPGKTANFLDSICGDLTTCLRPSSVDVLIFNPPYVPTEELPAQWNDQSDYQSLSRTARFDRDSHLLSLSYAGGADGMGDDGSAAGTDPGSAEPSWSGVHSSVQAEQAGGSCKEGSKLAEVMAGRDCVFQWEVGRVGEALHPANLAFIVPSTG